MERKSSKEHSVVFLVEGEKVQVRKFGLEDFIFVVSSATNSVGTTLELAAFGSGPDAKNSRISASCFFSVHNHGFWGAPKFVHVDQHLVTGKEISSKINILK